VAKSRDGWISRGIGGKVAEGWMSKSVARELATAALWVRIQTSFKNHKCASQAKEWPTHPTKKIMKDYGGTGLHGYPSMYYFSTPTCF
jgi:hypothetical protein